MDPRAGTLAQPSDLIDVDALLGAYYDLAPDLDDPAQQVVFGTSRAPRVEPGRRVQRGAHRRDHRRDRGVPPRAGHRRPAVHRARHPRAVAPGLADRAGGARRRRRRGATSTPATRYTPTPAVSHAILRHNGAATSQGVRTTAPGWPTASSSRRPTTPRATAASSTTRPTAAPPTPTATSWIADRANEILRTGVEQVQRVRVDAGARRRHHAPPRLPGRVRRGPLLRPGPRGHPAARASGSAPTRSAARRSSTGARSASATASTSPW